MRYSTKAIGVGVVLGAAAVVLAQQGESPPTEDVGAQPPAAEVACFNVRAVRSFDGLDDEHVYVEGNSNEHYLLTMSQRCPGLGTAEVIAVANPSARICGNSLAQITYEAVGGRAETCWVTQVEQVEDRAAAQELVDLRRQRTR